MKKKTFLATILTALCCLSCLFVACQKKIVFTFEANGGKCVATMEVSKNEEVTLPIPTKGGFDFEGWYLSADFSGAPVKSYKADKNTSFYAKWQKTAQYANIVLDAAGGTLTEKVIKGSVGAKVLDLVKNYKPVKTATGDQANVRFYAWYNGERAVTESTVLPEDGITLTAKYEYEYTMEVYDASLNAEGGYDKIEGHDKTAYALEGSTLKPLDLSKFGLSYANADKAALIVKTTKTENTFKLYYNRKQLTVTFDKNFPDGRTSDNIRKSVLSGNKMELPKVEEECDGYLFAGWSKSENGNVEYAVDSVSSKLYSVKAEESKSEFTPESNVTLYGVWIKGYVDMFGGDDLIFIYDVFVDGSDEPEKAVYLYRGGYFFAGTYNEDTGAFGFFTKDNKNAYTGSVLNDVFFVYVDTGRMNTYYEYSIYFDENGRMKTKVSEDVTLSVSADNRVTYDDNGVESRGSFVLENGTYTITFDDGALAGQTMNLIMGTVGSGKSVFQKRNEEEYDKKLLRYVVSNNVLTAIDEKYGYYLYLNGFGVAYMVTSEQTQGFYYNYNNGFIDLYAATGAKAGSFKLIDELKDDNGNGIKGYMYYNSSLNNVFVNEAAGGQLSLDGLYKARYFDGSNVYDGKYVQKLDSSLGGTLVAFTGDTGKTFTFILYAEKQADKTYKYTYKVVHEDYAEYSFVKGNLLYKNRIISLNETGTEDMTIYAADKSGNYVKVASGKYKAENGRYVFYDITSYEAENLYEVENFSNDFSGVTQIEFMISKAYGVIYWTKVTEGGNLDDNATVYTDKSGKAGQLAIFGNETTTEGEKTTTTVGAFATFTAEDETTYTGLFGNTGSFYYLAYLVENTSGSTSRYYFYFDLDHETKTYVLYQYAPYTAYAVDKNGSITQKEYIEADGKGGVKYVVVTVSEDDSRTTEEKSGTLTRTDEKVGNIYAYNFVSDDGTENFRMISFVSGNYYVFAKKVDNAGTYVAADGAELTLDGYILADYVTADNRKLQNVFYFKTDVENQVVLVYTVNNSSYAIYFDLKNGNEFSVRSSEYGTYMRIDNQGMSGMSFELDGYGTIADYGVVAHAVVKDYERDKDGNFVRDEKKKLIPVTVDRDAYYKIDTENGKTYIFVKYTAKNGDVVEIKGLLTNVSTGNGTVPALVEVHTEVEETYVNPEDWSVLVLTSYGVARKIDGKSGVATVGNYTIVTLDETTGKGLLYFSAGEESSIYRYDTRDRVAYVQKFEEKGYYTKDLSALFFSRYGYATYANGEENTTYFYDVDDEKNITVYHQDWYAEGHDEKYGFVAEFFGKHADVKTFHEITYLATNGNMTIAFKKATEELKKFPVQYDSNNKVYFGDIKFTPSGKDEFSSPATIDLYDENGDRFCDSDKKPVTFSATVKRVKSGEGKRTYIEISLSNGSRYEFDIDFEYLGKDKSTYQITSMKWAISGSGYFYNTGMMTLYIQMMQGRDVSAMLEEVKKLNYGTISFARTYLENGEIDEETVEASFTEYCPLKGEDGKLWKIEGSTVEVIAEDKENNTPALIVMKAKGFKMTNSGYKIDLVDGNNKYSAVIAFKSMSDYGFSGYGFYFAAINAVSELDIKDQNGVEYKVKVERVIAGENLAAGILGSVFDAELKDADGNVIERTAAYRGRNETDGQYDYDKLWYVSRTTDEETGKVTASKAYYLSFTGGVTADGEYTPYESATVRSYDLKVAYDNKNGSSFVEYIEDSTTGEKEVIFHVVCENNKIRNVYIVKSSEYDANTKTCTISEFGGSDLLVKFEEDEQGVVTVTISTK